MHICILNLYYVLSQHVKTVQPAELACNIPITYIKIHYDAVHNLLCDLFNQHLTLRSMIVASRIDNSGSNRINDPVTTYMYQAKIAVQLPGLTVDVADFNNNYKTIQTYIRIGIVLTASYKLMQRWCCNEKGSSNKYANNIQNEPVHSVSKDF